MNTVIPNIGDIYMNRNGAKLQVLAVDKKDVTYRLGDESSCTPIESFGVMTMLNDFKKVGNTKVQEHANPYAVKAETMCRSLTRHFDFEDDEAFELAYHRITSFIDAIIDEAMEYFPVDVYEPKLWKVRLSHESFSKPEEFEDKAISICRGLVGNISFNNDDDDDYMDEACEVIMEYVDALIEESMEYFPVDVYDPDLWDCWKEHEEKHNSK